MYAITSPPKKIYLLNFNKLKIYFSYCRYDNTIYPLPLTQPIPLTGNTQRTVVPPHLAGLTNNLKFNVITSISPVYLTDVPLRYRGRYHNRHRHGG